MGAAIKEQLTVTLGSIGDGVISMDIEGCPGDRARAFVSKPYDVKQLLQVVRKVLDE